jgi:hypothetical protein
VQEIKEIRGDMVEASWGAQIRNYVLHPYKMVKDQRTGWETSNAQAFLDGELLDDCIGAYLRYKAEKIRSGLKLCFLTTYLFRFKASGAAANASGIFLLGVE